MRIGIPVERKILEGRVALIPSDCEQLVAQGYDVFVETGAGVKSGYTDQLYSDIGATIVETTEKLYQQARYIVKVKEPVEYDLQYLREEHILFCFLHLAANRQLTDTLCDLGLTAIAFETVEPEPGYRPLLAPMSKVAGRLSVQIGTYLLEQPQGGNGIMLGGLDDTEAGEVIVLGGGVAGEQALKQAYQNNANVTVIDNRQQRLDELVEQYPAITALLSTAQNIEEAVLKADLLVGSVLLPAAHTPRLVTEAMVKAMKPGSVIVDISVDQGGCIETIRPTNYENPAYTVHDVLHFGVTNMPGAVPRTSSQALSQAIYPYLLNIVEGPESWNEVILGAINVEKGEIVHPVLVREFS